MLERLRQFLAEKYRFRIPIRADVPPRCTIRLLEEKDFPACESIYLLNEPGRFPQGLFPHFADWLRSGKTLVLIAEVDGQIRGFGGVNAQEQDGRHVAWLSFGMVHPDHHRTGFGTTLLLARLALVESRHDRCTALLTTTGGSETFYGRFGFTYFESYPGLNGYAGDTYFAQLMVRDRKRCMAALKQASLSPDVLSAVVPPFEDSSPTSNSETNREISGAL